MPTETLHNVPQAEVPDKVRAFIEYDNKTNVVCTKNPSETWEIVAT